MELVYIYPMDKSKDMQKMLDEEFWKRLGPTVRDCKAMGLDKDGMCIYIKAKDELAAEAKSSLQIRQPRSLKARRARPC